MKISVKLISAIAVAGLAYACVSTVPVYKISDTSCPTHQKGLYYNLPQTAVTIDVVASRTEISKADYASYGKYIGVQNVPSVKYTIEEIKIGSHKVADPSQWHFLDLSKHGLFKRVSVTLSTDADGTIATGSAEVENLAPQYTMEIIDFIGSAALTFIPFSKASPLADGNGIERIDLFEYANSIEFPIFPLKTRTDSLAYNAIRQLNDLEVKRMALIGNATGTSISAEALKIMLGELDQKKQELLSLFAGTKTVTKTTFQCTAPNTSGSSNLFKFDATNGFSDLIAGTVINENFKSTTPSGQQVTVDFNIAQPLPTSLTTTAPKKKKTSFFYRIPANTTVQVKKGNSILSMVDILIAQNGVDKSLPLRTGGVKTKYELKYDAKTGALIDVKVNGEPVSSETVEAAKTTGEGILNAIKPKE